MTVASSGEVLGRSERRGRGESLANKADVLTKEKLYRQLDFWAEDAGHIARRVTGQ
jgi:hypothetical protein